jgi:hypothetical protein
VADKVGDIYSTDSSLSDFINDSDGDDDDESVDSKTDASSKASSNKGHCNTSSTKKTLLKRRKQTISSDSDEESDINSERKGSNSRGKTPETKKNKTKSNKNNLRKKLGNTRTRSQNNSRRKNTIDSDDSDDLISVDSESNYDDDENLPLSTFLNKTPKTTKKKKVIPTSSDSETDKEFIMQEDSSNSDDNEKAFTKLKDPPSRPRSSRRMTLIQKQQDSRDKKYKELMKRRNKAKHDPKDLVLEENNQATTGNTEEIQKESHDEIEIFNDLIENCNDSDEFDKEFVVSDDASEEEVVPDQDLDIKFLKLLDNYSQTASDNDDETLNSPPSGFSVQRRRKGIKKRKSSSKWRRINTRVESDESDDSDSKIKEEYDHNCQLHMAVNQNDVDLVKAILQQDPTSIYAVGYRKRSVLHLAALNGNADMVQLLLKMKANYDILDKYTFPPIVYAANGHSECLKIFLRHTDIKKVNKELIQTPSKMSLLHFAVGETRTGEECTERGRCLEFLFAHDDNICTKMLQHRDARRRNPLEAAVYASQHQVTLIKLILAYVARVFPFPYLPPPLPPFFDICHCSFKQMMFYFFLLYAKFYYFLITDRRCININLNIFIKYCMSHV